MITPGSENRIQSRYYYRSGETRKHRKQCFIEFHMSQAKQTFENNTNHAWEDFQMLPVGPTFENDADHVSAMSLPVSSDSENDTIHYKSRRKQKIYTNHALAMSM